MSDYVEEFSSYSPAAWQDRGVLIASALRRVVSGKREKGLRSTIVLSFPRTLVAAGLFAASTLLLDPTTVGTSRLNIPALSLGERRPIFVEPLGNANPSPLIEINRGFDALFEGMRSGTRLTIPDGAKDLAQKAVQLRNEKVDIDSWARRLADDVKDADD